MQLVDTHDYDLAPAAPDVLRVIDCRSLAGEVKPEITQGMIEIATGICGTWTQALGELAAIRTAMVRAADRLNVAVCGGGTHPFQHWSERRIYDEPRYRRLSDLYGYLAKQFTVFGQHVHIGCAEPDDALYLLHAMARYVPHLIALSASSPFVQGQDTGFQSARLNSVSAFPLSGRAPFSERWEQFSAYFERMRGTGIVESMKDFYWDIRPKPEYGTVEVRVMDTPLTVERAALLAACVQVLAHWLLGERPFRPGEDDYLVYGFNRFQACRFGLHATYVDPETHEHRVLADALAAALPALRDHASELGAGEALERIAEDLRAWRTDAGWMRLEHDDAGFLPEVVRRACLRWRESGSL
jgi:carboxylate-amine ligase